VTKLISVVETPLYLARAARLMTEAEREEVVTTVAAAPDAGVIVKGTGGLRKLRILLQGRGKRGGGRVIYWFHSVDYPAVLLLAFAKNEGEDVTSEERKRLIGLSAILMEQLGGRR
jgi:hypothetical protein